MRIGVVLVAAAVAVLLEVIAAASFRSNDTWTKLKDTDDLPPFAQLLHTLRTDHRLHAPRACVSPTGRSIDITVSHYGEHLPALGAALVQFINATSRLRDARPVPCVWLMTKDPKISSWRQAHDQLVAGGLTPHIAHLAFVSLPNRGREALSMLVYLALHRMNATFPSHTAFIHEDIFNGRNGPNPLRMSLLAPTTGLLGLSLTDGTSCAHLRGYDPSGRLVSTMSGGPCERIPGGHWVTFWSAQFVVSRTRMMAVPLATYEQLLAWIGAGTNHWIHDGMRAAIQRSKERAAAKAGMVLPSNATGGRPPPYPEELEIPWAVPRDQLDVSNPAIGHALERTWGLLFNCSNTPGRVMVDVVQCDTPHPPPGSCQCVDPGPPRSRRMQ